MHADRLWRGRWHPVDFSRAYRAGGHWGSIAELQAWLDRGPLLMDGGRWFGQGHWFVGVGYDSGGVYIRDSSGWDNRYLSWARPYGEVGFNGWVVGVAA